MDTDWIKRIMGMQIGDEGMSLAEASIPGLSRPRSLLDAEETLAGEFARARRYEQTLTIVVASSIRLDGSRSGRSGSSNGNRSGVGNGNGNGTEDANGNGTGNGNGNGNGTGNGTGDRNGRSELLSRLAGDGFREALRQSDVVCYRPVDDHFVLGFPQTSGDEARQAMTRVGGLFHEHLEMDLVAGVASFPADGLTLEDLESTARGRAVAMGPEGESPTLEVVAPSQEVSDRRTSPRFSGRRTGVSHPSGNSREAREGE